MGHLTNARGFRLGKSVSWNVTLHDTNSPNFLGNLLAFNSLYFYFKRKFTRFFKPQIFGLLFSHYELRRYGSKMFVGISAFNGFYDVYLRKLFHWLKKGRKNRSKSSIFKKNQWSIKSNVNYWVREKFEIAKVYKQICIGVYKAMSQYLSLQVSLDLRNVFVLSLKFYQFFCKLNHLSFRSVTASVLGDYIIKRYRLGYRVEKILYPILTEARKFHKLKGIYFKFKGRYTRKPRSVVNKKVFKYGNLGLATVTAPLDYAFRRFETRFGTCSIKIWVNY